MINTKQTLKNLHKKFPMMSLDELFEALDCYVEETNLFTPLGNKPIWETTTPSKPWYENQVTSLLVGDEKPIIATNNSGYSLTGGIQSE